MFPQQQRVSGALATSPMARLHAASGALHTVIRESRNAPGGPRVLSVGEERGWQAPYKRLGAVQ